MKLPRLPKPVATGVQHQRCHIGSVYTAEQMKAYAAKAVEAEREACAKIVEETKWSNWFQTDCVCAIRARQSL